jgi:isoquinoline 1-oxidoreductase beta subunit
LRSLNGPGERPKPARSYITPIAFVGMIVQSNYSEYSIARMSEARYQTNVYFVDSDARPTGIAEPGVPRFIAAFCTAIYAATGKRVRELHISKQKLV